MKNFIELSLIVIGFSDYWIKKSYDEGKRIRAHLLQFAFIAVFSLLITTFTLIVGIALYVFITKDGNLNPNGYTLLLSNLFVMFWLSVIFYLNSKQEFNIPAQIVELSVIVANLKKEKRAFGLGEITVYLILTVLLSSALLVGAISCFTGYFISGAAIVLCLVICGTMSVALYSEITLNTIERAIRQLNIWLLIFIVLIVLSLINLNNIITVAKVEDAIIPSGLLIFGIYYNIATISDKIRLFLQLSRKKYCKQIEESRIALHEATAHEKEIQENILVMKYVRSMWMVGGWKSRVRIIISVLFGVVIYVILIWFSNFMRNFSLVDFF